MGIRLKKILRRFLDLWGDVSGVWGLLKVIGAPMGGIALALWSYTGGLPGQFVVVISLVATVAIYAIVLLYVDHKGESKKKRAGRAKEIYRTGENLFELVVDDDGWMQRFQDWIDEAEQIVEEIAPKEAFMFSTVSPRPQGVESIDDCKTIVQARLVKLRFITSRLMGNE